MYWGMVQAVNYIDPDTDLTSLDESSWNQTIFAIRNSDVGTSDNTRFYLELASIFDWNGGDDGFGQMQEDALAQGNREAHILARWLLGNYQMGPTGQLYLSEEVQRRVETLLASAPCYGPCSGGANCKNPIGCCGSNRWIVPNRQSNCHEINGNFKFNGVDYMLLYNF